MYYIKPETTNKPLKRNHQNETAETNETKPTKQSGKPLSLLKANRERANLSVVFWRTGMLLIQANQSKGLQVTDSLLALQLICMALLSVFC